jgi:hypothetical protein
VGALAGQAVESRRGLGAVSVPGQLDRQLGELTAGGLKARPQLRAGEGAGESFHDELGGSEMGLGLPAAADPAFGAH